MWSAGENLMYYLVEIHDDVFIDGYVWPQGGYPNYDIVEVFLDEDHSGGPHIFDTQTENAENAFSYHIAATAPAEGQVSHDFVVCDIAGTSWSNEIIPNYAGHFPDFAMKKNGNTYVYEFSMKVYSDEYDDANPEASRVNLSEGKVMGMSVAYCDNDENDGERDNFFGSVWVTADRYNSHWESADDYGVLTLEPSSGNINHPPVLSSLMPDVSIDEHNTDITVAENLNDFFTDEDGDVLDFQASSSDAGVVPDISGNSLKVTVSGSFKGSCTIQVKASDMEFNVTGEFSLTALNRPPVVTGEMSDFTLTTLKDTFTLVQDIGEIFSDPDQDDLTYSVSSADQNVFAFISGMSSESLYN